MFATKEGREASRAMMRYSGVGLSLALGVGFFTWLGAQVGTRLGSESAGLAAGCLLGAVLGLVKLVRDVSRIADEDETRQDGGTA